MNYPRKTFQRSGKRQRERRLLPFEPGTTAKIEGSRARATVLRPSRGGDEVVVRLSEVHPRKKSQKRTLAEIELLTKTRKRFDELAKKAEEDAVHRGDWWHIPQLTREEDDEMSSLAHILSTFHYEQSPVPKPVRLQNVAAVDPSLLSVKQRQTPKSLAIQHVPAQEKRLSKARSLLLKAFGSHTFNSWRNTKLNPKRMLRFLRRRGVRTFSTEAGDLAYWLRLKQGERTNKRRRIR